MEKDIKLKLAIVVAILLMIFSVWGSREKIKSTFTTINNKKLPIYCVKTDKKQVALSFDAAWGNEDTKAILDILKANNAFSSCR